MEINYSIQEISVKIVYYGPGLSGKTTNLEIIHAKTPEGNRGRLTAISTEQDRTLFFDYMPLEIGKIGNFKVRLRLFTVPGQVYYNTTRKLVLRCVDGLVFVADSQEHKIQENVESLQNLRDNLLEQGDHIENMPVLLQMNKRDLPCITPMGELAEILNQAMGMNAPCLPAVAVKGDGVFQCLKEIANMTMSKVEASLNRPKRKKIPKKVKQATTKINMPRHSINKSKAKSPENKTRIGPQAKVAPAGKNKPKIKLSPLGSKPKLARPKSFQQPPINTPPRGLPNLANLNPETKKATRPINMSKKEGQPINQTMRKPAIAIDRLFQGSLTKSGPTGPNSPSRGGVIDTGAKGLSATPPSSMTPISSPSLKSESVKKRKEEKTPLGEK